MVRATHEGSDAPEIVMQRTVLEISNGAYEIRFDQSPVDRGDLSQELESKTLVLAGKSGTNSGRIIKCLYQRVGDRLRICFGLDGSPPSEFTAKAGQNRYLATYRKC